MANSDKTYVQQFVTEFLSIVEPRPQFIICACICTCICICICIFCMRIRERFPKIVLAFQEAQRRRRGRLFSSVAARAWSTHVCLKPFARTCIKGGAFKGTARSMSQSLVYACPFKFVWADPSQKRDLQSSDSCFGACLYTACLLKRTCEGRDPTHAYKHAFEFSCP